jgi:cytoskeleton protein RodZ
MSAPGDAPHGGSAVGTLLRATRQRHGLSVHDVARSLRIRAPYIEAIEDGRFADLPAPAYAVGFVKAYAKALALDEAEILRRFRTEAEGLGKRTRLEFPAPVPERGVPAGALAMLGLVLAAGAYGSWWYMSGSSRLPEVTSPPPQVLAMTDPAPRTPAPAIVPPPADQRAVAGPLASLPPISLAPSAPPAGIITPAPVAVIPPVASPPPPAPLAPAATHSAASAQAAVPLAPSPPPLAGASLPEGMFGALPAEDSRVLVRARAETWIQVRDRSNGSVVFNRTLQPGQSYRVPMKPGLLLTIGNAPGTDVVVDGQVVANPFPATSVRRDIPLEPDRVREAMAAPPVTVRAPTTPAAPTPGNGAAAPFTWAN